jgi:hypothetical protein
LLHERRASSDDARMRKALALALFLTACHTSSPPTAGDDDAITPDASADDDPQPDAEPPFDPAAGVEWLAWPEQQPNLGEAAWGDALIDVARHIPAEYGDTYWFDEPITAAHETTHGIQAHLRNYETPSGSRMNAFYVLDDRAALVDEPDIRKSDVNAHVPQALRGPRFDLYLEGQTEWDDTPLYLFDEWNAYCNGAAIGIDQVEHDLYDEGWTDAVMGPLEFTVYAIATAKAVAAGDPDYFESNLQFRRFTAWEIRRAMQLFETGRAMTEFEWDDQDDYAAELRTGAAAEELRAFARATWGDAWTEDVLGF